ncbi:MAG: double-strand break repair helicase AddA [Micavibrio aeruginosavorus]|uniref:DNA 3'-5' helicase n=1 Tax=Micavibrio aeruginosavorus TaxID=349221 RepID=A0A2W5N8K9_9BACT|nr:MAG: double-strand break repair helicase AddA [Micavibrio aeruginosavorus]
MSELSKSAHSIEDIISEATVKQRSASDPGVSAWVGASAGSGKTKVLTDRMLRLLLPRENRESGTKPEKILALTFTKAGANEMALRLSKRLADWAVMDDDALAKAMDKDLFGRPPTTQEMNDARKLFARVVDTPGGLKIMTIHSFCQSVLGRFPIEAGLTPNFVALDDAQARELLDKARKSILSHASTNATDPLSAALANISTSMNEDQFSKVLFAMSGERHQLRQTLRRTFGTYGLYTNLCETFGIVPGRDEASVLRLFCTPENNRESALREACASLANGMKTDQKRADIIQAFWDCPSAERASMYDDYKKAFLDGKGAPSAKLVTQGVLAKNPDIETILRDEQALILSLEEERRAIFCASLTRDLFLTGTAILDRYDQEKEFSGALDFEDMILKTLSLFKGDNFKGIEAHPNLWIMYKMDEGLEHILVDEAQDTNPEQWDIIDLLTEDFFTGRGAKQDIVRSLFVVGDDKQSIFSFQRAAPKKFGDMREKFAKKIHDGGQVFRPVAINTSFRSVQLVLDLVDTVFKDPAVARGVSLGPYLSHIAKRDGQAGLIEFWPTYRTIKADSEAEDEELEGGEQLSFNGWDMPDKIVESQGGSSSLASKIGDMINDWLHVNPQRLESRDKNIEAGDILILVRSRTPFVGQLIRALKTNKIPVNGMDRMILSEQLVVQDLCAAAAFALLPDDDLALAELLKSPFIGVDEDILYALTRDKSSTLWSQYNKNGDSISIEWLRALIERGRSEHPYEFFSRIIQEPCPADSISGMRAIRKRLGDDALDPLDEFLNSTLSYESVLTPGLQGFLKWHQDLSSELKREQEEAGKSVRIMTVHGSKGLQAPIVFLPDTIHAKPKLDPVLWPNKTGDNLLYYAPNKDRTPAHVQKLQGVLEQAAEEEYRRLLYVAMTRAEDRLYVGGYTGTKNKTGAHWYEDIRRAFSQMEGVQAIPSDVFDDKGNNLPVYRLISPQQREPDKTSKEKEGTKFESKAIDEWAYKPAPREAFPPKPLVPSRPSGEQEIAASPRTEADKDRFRRGNATHRLLQLLPALPPAQRAAAAEGFLTRPALGLPPELQIEIMEETFAVLNDTTFGDIFGEGSIAEVPITGLVEGNLLVSGQIDRLLIRDKEILIVDFKTNRPPPTDAQDVPDLYKNQMKAYARTLKEIYPDKKIRCALLWTHGARLMEIAL